MFPIPSQALVPGPFGGGVTPVSVPRSFLGSSPEDTPVLPGIPPQQGCPLARTGVPLPPGQVTLRAVRLLQFPAGGLSCNVNARSFLFGDGV